MNIKNSFFQQTHQFIQPQTIQIPLSKSHKKHKEARIGRLVKVTKIDNYSGISYLHKLQGFIPSLNQDSYKIIDRPVSGDAPKDFIQLMDGLYIAKVGHKWYPLESMTEYLLNQIGETLGLKMAKSKLVLIHGQLRFLSKYFLGKSESLIHGAELYSAYLEEGNTDFVDMIELERKTSEWFTFQVSIEAIGHQYPLNQLELMNDFVKMIVFDAITGNNDRHFYNWGVVENIYDKNKSTFAPIYDTARGLFWNYSEEKINTVINQKGDIDFRHLKKYADNSVPKIGWNNHQKLNHFQLATKIFREFPQYHDICTSLMNNKAFESIIDMMEKDFKNFFSKKRFILIQECLKYRFQELQNLCGL